MGGFVGYDNEPGNLSTCAAYGRVTGTSGSTMVGGFSGYNRGRTSYSNWNGLLYNYSSNLNNTINNPHEYHLRRGYYECLDDASDYPRPPESHPSNTWLVGLTYPFRTVSYNGAVLPFYGDWPTPVN